MRLCVFKKRMRCFEVFHRSNLVLGTRKIGVTCEGCAFVFESASGECHDARIIDAEPVVTEHCAMAKHLGRVLDEPPKHAVEPNENSERSWGAVSQSESVNTVGMARWPGASENGADY